jgi:chromosome segregation ATPase
LRTIEERLLIMEQSLATTQEQLSQQVGKCVKLEQQSRKLQTELKTMKERNVSYEDEIKDQKQTIGTTIEMHASCDVLIFSSINVVVVKLNTYIYGTLTKFSTFVTFPLEYNKSDVLFSSCIVIYSEKS